MTDKQGFAQLGTTGAGIEGEPKVAFGIYKVEITHPSKTISARFNQETKLSQEISPDSYTTEGVVFRLKS